MEKAIGEGRTLVNLYNRNMARKIAAFLKEWDISVVPYVKSWKPSYFNRVNYKSLTKLREELLMEFKKKFMEVCEILNITQGHVI